MEDKQFMQTVPNTQCMLSTKRSVSSTNYNNAYTPMKGQLSPIIARNDYYDYYSNTSNSNNNLKPQSMRMNSVVQSPLIKVNELNSNSIEFIDSITIKIQADTFSRN